MSRSRRTELLVVVVVVVYHVQIFLRVVMDDERKSWARMPDGSNE